MGCSNSVPDNTNTAPSPLPVKESTGNISGSSGGAVDPDADVQLQIGGGSGGGGNASTAADGGEGSSSGSSGGSGAEITLSKLTTEDFEFLKVLGKGTFGKVQLVRKKTGEKKFYAMKTLKKKDLKDMKQEKNTETERYVLLNVKSPYLIALYYAFQDSNKLHLVVDFLAGGELFTWLRDHRAFSESRTRLYAAEIIMGIEALHKANIAYRDLKTENILLDNVGHIKICDFGLSKQNITSMSSGASTRCGTTELMAPEIYGTNGYGKAVDWWSLGILIYQMIHGKFPFEDNDPTRLVQKVLTCEAKFKDSVSKECKDTVKGLLNKNVKHRLGNSSTNEIKKSPFFAKIDFVQVQMKRYTPEFRPPVDKSLSTFPGFDDMFIKETPGDSFMPAESRDSTNDNYSGFTYIEKSDK